MLGPPPDGVTVARLGSRDDPPERRPPRPASGSRSTLGKEGIAQQLAALRLPELGAADHDRRRRVPRADPGRRDALRRPRRARRVDLRVGAHRGALLRRISGVRPEPGATSWDQKYTDELAGKRVLIVGAGDVGESIRRRMLPFDTTTMVPGRARDDAHGVDELPGAAARARRGRRGRPAHRGDPRAGRRRVPGRDGRRGAVRQRRPRAGRGHRRVLAEQPGRLRAPSTSPSPSRCRPTTRSGRRPNLLLTPHVGGSVPLADGSGVRGSPPSRSRQFAGGNTPPNLVKDGY